LATFCVAGVIPIATSSAAVTVTVVAADTPPRNAVIVVEPGLSAVTCPAPPGGVLTEATVGTEEVQLARLVTFCVDLSEYTAIAVRGWRTPLARLGFAGVTPMETRVAAVTVRVVDPDTPCRLAVITVAPGLSPVACPLEPELLATEATVTAEEVQVAEVVRSRVVLSEYTPVALSAATVPLARLGFAGVTPMETRVASVTVNIVDADIPPSVAVIVVVPALSADAMPNVPAALLIEAMVGLDELHTTCDPTACFVPSLYRAVPANATVEPIETWLSGGATAREVN
jgi:hypothetical protein